MRSIVLEIKENKAAVLDDKGIVHAIRNRDYEVGQVLCLTELELKREEVSAKTDGKQGIAGRHAALIRTAAAILAVAIIGGGVTSYAAPVSTVSIDGASGVEYRLNIYDRVVGVSAVDDADESFKKEMSDFSGEIRGMEISDAIDATATRFENEMFGPDPDGNKPEVTIRVGGLKKRNRKLSDKMDHKKEEINKKIEDGKGAGITNDMPVIEKDMTVPETDGSDTGVAPHMEAADGNVMDTGKDRKPDDAAAGEPEPSQDIKEEIPAGKDKELSEPVRSGERDETGVPENSKGSGEGRKTEDSSKPDDIPAPAGDAPEENMGKPSGEPPAEDTFKPQDMGNGEPARDNEGFRDGDPGGGKQNVTEKGGTMP